MPVYNGECFVEEQLSSIFCLCGNSNSRLYVYDDCSQDNTLSIVFDFCTENNVDLVVLNGVENIGVNAAFHKLVEKAFMDGYEWIFFVDQDDIWSANKVCHQLSIAKSLDYMGVFLLSCPSIPFSSSHRSMGLDSNFNQCDSYSSQNLPRTVFRNYSPGHTAVISRGLACSYLKGTSYLCDRPLRMYDFFLYQVAVVFGAAILVCNCHVHHRLHAKNASYHGFFARSLSDRFQYLDNHFDAINYLMCLNDFNSDIYIPSYSHKSKFLSYFFSLPLKDKAEFFLYYFWKGFSN